MRIRLFSCVHHFSIIFIHSTAHACRLTGASFNSLPESTADLSCPWKSGPGLCPQEGGGWRSCHGRARSIPATHGRCVPRHSHRHPGGTTNAPTDGAGTGQRFYRRVRGKGSGQIHPRSPRDTQQPQVREQTSLKDGEWWVLAEKNEITRRTMLVFPGVWEAVLLGSQHCAALFCQGVGLELTEPRR